MATLFVTGQGDTQITPGGHDTGLKRNSVPLSQLPAIGAIGGNGAIAAVDGQTLISYANLYMSQPIVAASVHKIARQISRLPLKAYRRTRAGRERLSRTSNLQQLLNRPFRSAGSTHLKQAIMIPSLVHGNSVFWKSRSEDGGPVVGLHPMKWQMLKPNIADDGLIDFWETTQRGPWPRRIDPGDLLHFGFRGLDDPIGISPLQQLGVTLAIEDAAQRHQKALLKNGARPPSAVEASQEFLGLERDERQVLLNQLRADITLIYAGPENQGRPALLPPGLTWKPVGHTAVEAELINQRKLTREEVTAVYDIPPPLIGILEYATLANVAEAHRMLYTTILAPWLTLIEETMQAQLIDLEPTLRGDLYVEFDLSEVLKGDTLQRSQALALQIGHGVLTIDEAREIENRPTFDLPETSKPLYPANNLIPVGEEPPEPSEDAVAEAAEVVANMDHDDLRRLLMTTGSTVDAILAVSSGYNPNGRHEEGQVA